VVVYCTINIINGKIYVGKDSKNNKYYLGSGSILKKAINKYGKENFKKFILEECYSIEDLNNKEKFWIEKLKSKDHKIGYNLSDGGDGGQTGVEPWNKGKHWDDGTKQKIRESNSGKSKIEHSRWIDLDINEIIRLNDEGHSYEEISKFLGVKKQIIYKRLKDTNHICKTNKKTTKGYKHTDESKNKMSNYAKKRIKDKNPNYKVIDVNNILLLISQNKTKKEICNILGISFPTLNSKLKDNNIIFNKNKKILEG
jgi:group I intron endonuclease